MIQLGVNIDHVATVRQARRGVEPDPVRAAHEAELGGADIITAHLREDRRHINDEDVDRLRSTVGVRFNLEMAATDEMVEIACRVRPHMVTLVPEGREEITTEGGLDVAGQMMRLREVVRRLRDAEIVTSAFVDPEPRQIRAAAESGFDACELHTGPYAHSFAKYGGDFRHHEMASIFERLARSGEQVREAGLRFNAGHALNYVNVRPVASLPGLEELHIGHAIVSRAVYTGLREAVGQMKHTMQAEALASRR